MREAASPAQLLSSGVNPLQVEGKGLAGELHRKSGSHATARKSRPGTVLENAAMPAVNRATLLETAPSRMLVITLAMKISRAKTRIMHTVSASVVSIGTF